ncbi:MAG: hypothetical protein AB1563_00120 [Bacillota bacterium]
MESAGGDRVSCLFADQIAWASFLKGIELPQKKLLDEFGRKVNAAELLMQKAAIRSEFLRKQIPDWVNRLQAELRLKIPPGVVKKRILEMQDAARLMNQHGWWLLMNLTVPFYLKLLEVKEHVTSEWLTSVITAEFNRDNCLELERMVHSWSAEPFVKRRDIFDDALWVHRLGKYTLTVPTLMLQVEGVIRHFMESSYGVRAYRFADVRAEFRERVRVIEELPEEEELSFTQLRLLANYYNLEYLDAVFSRYDPSQHVEPDDLNRHALYHGLWITYASMGFSTKLFLLLDSLESVLGQLTGESPVASASGQ